jgi:hypothetical protein
LRFDAWRRLEAEHDAEQGAHRENRQNGQEIFNEPVESAREIA